MFLSPINGRYLKIMTLKVIAYARNGHTDKFGIPRQSREESPILTRIVFEPEYCVEEALRGIEGFSHLWLIWGFSELGSLTADAERPSDDCKTQAWPAVRPQDKPAVGLSWSPTVRPPRLGGNKRMGVFATRSPFRPIPKGLSSVRLINVQRDNVQSTKDKEQGTKEKGQSTKKCRLELIVSGADLMDGTPIYDIKPYLSFSDCHEDAQNGFAEETKDYRLDVEWGAVGEQISPRVKEEITYILSQDPRPAYQDDPEREYKLDYAGLTVGFKVQRDKVVVREIRVKS